MEPNISAAAMPAPMPQPHPWLASARLAEPNVIITARAAVAAMGVRFRAFIWILRASDPPPPKQSVLPIFIRARSARCELRRELLPRLTTA
jgi:hypothetical protein